jgi:hypothetical protein
MTESERRLREVPLEHRGAESERILPMRGSAILAITGLQAASYKVFPEVIGGHQWTRIIDNPFPDLDNTDPSQLLPLLLPPGSTTVLESVSRRQPHVIIRSISASRYNQDDARRGLEYGALAISVGEKLGTRLNTKGNNYTIIEGKPTRIIIDSLMEEAVLFEGLHANNVFYTSATEIPLTGRPQKNYVDRKTHGDL